MTPIVNPSFSSIRRLSSRSFLLVYSLASLTLSRSSSAFVTTLSSSNLFINNNSPYYISRRQTTTEHGMTAKKSSSSTTDNISSESSSIIVPLSFVTSSPPTPKTSQTNDNNSEAAAAPPTTVFLHGLDSSSQTWSRIQSKLSTPSIAIDVRGCGSSPMGHPDDFGIETVVQDIKSLLDCQLNSTNDDKTTTTTTTTKFVLVGHSMGAKIATYYTARYPNDVAALVMEDMDIRRRPAKDNPIVPIDDSFIIKGFDRRFESYDDMAKALTMAGYPPERIEKWRGEGRLTKRRKSDDDETNGGGNYYWWSDVNPEFRHLCYRHFCDNDSATQTWKDVASLLRQHDALRNEFSFPCHLLVAAPELTICSEDSIRDMCDIMPSLKVRRWKDATHSIHNSAQDEFLEVLEGVIKDVSL